MESSTNAPLKNKRYPWKSVGNIFVIIILSILFLIFLAAILIQTAPVQNFARVKIQKYLVKKLKTKVEIGKIDIHFPNSIFLKDIFIADQSKDTLLSGGELKVNINMLQLLKNEVQIRNIDLNDITVKIKRLQPDTVFNFQFIIDAFMGKAKSLSKDTSTDLKMKVDNININRSRIIYRDTISGNDMDVYVKHFATTISTFDPYHLYFNVPTITLSGLKGYFYQNEPLKQKIVEAVAAAVSTTSDTYLEFKNSKFSLSDIDINYKSVPTNIATSVKIGSFEAHPDTINLRTGIFDLKDVTLVKSNIGVTMSEDKAPPISNSEQAAINSLPTFTLKSDNLKIVESRFSLNNISVPSIKNGIDYSHLDIRDLNLEASNLFFNVDSITTTIKSASLKEKSGFVLNELNTTFAYTQTGASLNDLFLKTPGTLLRKDFRISYPSINAVTKNPGLMSLNLDIHDSKIQVKDLLVFAPMLRALKAFGNPSETWMLDGRVTGRIDNIFFNNLKIKGHQTSLNVTGTVKGLPDVKKFHADLNLPYFSTTRRDIESFIPAGTLPSTFKLPEIINASGKIRVSMNELVTNLSLSTNIGSAILSGTVKNFADPKMVSYDMKIAAKGLNLGLITGNLNQMGKISTDFVLKGSGFDPKIANTNFNGTISQIEFNKYTYKNIRLKGFIKDKLYSAIGSIHDKNADLSFEASGSLKGKYPSLKISAEIDSLKTFPLHITSEPLTFHGIIKGDFSNTDPDNLAGHLFLTHAILLNSSQRFQFDSLQLIASVNANVHNLVIQSNFFNLAIIGVYKLTQLPYVIQQSIDPYFLISSKKNSSHVDAYDFTLTGGVVDNPALRAFMPSISKLKPITFSSRFASDSGWSATLSAPYIQYEAVTIQDLNLDASTSNDKLNYVVSISQLKSGGSVSLNSTSLKGFLQNNKMDFTLNTQDIKSVNKYTVSGVIDQISLNSYSFMLRPENLLLNYSKWTINSNNSIKYSNHDLVANNFILTQGKQQISLNSIGIGSFKPLRIDFKDFNISTLTAFVQADSLIVNGVLSGNATIKDIQRTPTFTSDLTVAELSIYKDTIGTLSAKIDNPLADQYDADINLIGRGNNLSVIGRYNVRPQNNSNFNLGINITSLQMTSLEGFTKGFIRNSRGNLYGKIDLKGTLANPNIDGKINFNHTAFTVTPLNSVFKIDKSAIAVVNTKGIQFNKFTIRDTAENAIIIDGLLGTKDFLNYNFNLTVNADNFQAINSTKKDNHLFYGKMIFSTSLTVRGTPDNPVIDGSLDIKEKTNFSIVLPQNEPGVVQREGIVRFINYSKRSEDSLFMMSPYDSLKMSPFQGYNVSVNINISKEATFNLIVDEGNGDFLKLKGEGQLTGGIDESGKITLVGSYDINEGSYDLSFNFIKRKFLIQKGSRIVWTGEPTTADINVTAIYVANTPPLDLVQGQTVGDPNIYKQKLPFEVHLGISGELLEPQITFNIILPEEKNYSVSKDIITTVETKLSQLRQEPGELNKQVFALLLLNRFVGQNPFDNSSGGSLDANTFARQSVSRLLTEQLNKLTEGLIEGVDINFDLATTEDYTTGSKQNRTDFNIGLSKRLLNDRLTVTVGSNFELEGPRPINQQQNNVAGNIAIDYKLSKNGRYLLRAYRKNDYQGAIEGFVIETGIGFIISVDYDHLREILQYQKSKKAITKKMKREDKEINIKKKNEELLNKEVNDGK